MALDLVATLRFNDHLTHGLRRARDQINHTSDSMNVLGRNNAFGSLTARVGGLAAAIGGAIGAAGLLNATIGEAMRYEGQEILITALFNDEKLSKDYTAMMQRVAEESPVLNSGDMMQASSGLVGLSKDMGELEKAWKVVEKMKIINPMEDENGSLIALKELASGDVVSMAERFNIPKSVLNDIKKLSFDEQLDGLTEYMNGMGLTSEAVDKYGQSTIAKWNAIEEKTSSIFRTMGTDGNSALSKAFDGILTGMDSGAFDGLAKMIDSGLGKAVTATTGWIQRVDWQQFSTKAQETFTTMSNAVAKASSFIKTHWDTIVFTTKMVVGAFVGLKALSFVVGVFATISSAVATGIRIFRALKTALSVAKTAFLIIRGVMLMFPATWIVAAIGAVIAVGIALYKNWDTVKEKTAQLWAKFKETTAFRVIKSGMDKVMSVANKVKDAFSSLKDGISNAMSKARIAVTDSVNGIIDKVNWLIEKLNAIPGVNVPLVAKVQYDTSGSVDTQVAGVTNNISNSVSGPHALGNHSGWNEIRTDGTLRSLHAGERVLTAVENDGYKQMMNSGLPGAIAKIASLNPLSISSASTSNTTNMNNVDNRMTSNVSNVDNRMTSNVSNSDNSVVSSVDSRTTNAYSTTNDSTKNYYRENAFTMPSFNDVPILNAINKLATPISVNVPALDVNSVVTAIERMAERAINVVVPQDGSANAVAQLRDIITGNQPMLTATETQAVSNNVSNSSFSESVSNVSTTNNSKTSNSESSKVINVGGITFPNLTIREEADIKKLASAFADEIAAF